MSDLEIEKVIERVRKLLNLAGKNPNEAEAASAAKKAQELLEAYNLSLTTIEQNEGGSGKREDARHYGGMYVYERELWEAIAQLNFCWYFTTRGTAQVGRGRKISFQHRLVGRVVNTTATKVMAGYLQGAIERMCRERFEAKQFFSREAVAFREGMSDNLVRRLEDRRRKNEREDERKKKARMAGADTRFALTLTDVKDAEEKANYDFLHGEGAWDRREAANREYEAEWEKRRTARAAAEAAAEAAYAEWAIANPEEAAREEKKRKAEADRAAKKEHDSRARRVYRYREPTARERRESSAYYAQGYERAEKVSIDQQMDDRRPLKRIGAS